MQFKFNYVDATAITSTTTIDRPNLQLNITGQGDGIGSGY